MSHLVILASKYRFVCLINRAYVPILSTVTVSVVVLIFVEALLKVVVAEWPENVVNHSMILVDVIDLVVDIDDFVDAWVDTVVALSVVAELVTNTDWLVRVDAVVDLSVVIAEFV